MMATTRTSTPQDQLDDLLTSVLGRVARPAGTIDWSDREGVPARILAVARMRDRLDGTAYRVDDSLIAGAIIDRLRDIGLIARLH